MVQIVYLEPGEEMPDSDDERWILVHASDDGLFFGSGGSRKESGEWVGYRSLIEDDVDLDHALKAAREWAALYDVPTIWVQRTP